MLERTFTTARGEVTSMTLSRDDVLEDLSRPPMMPAMRPNATPLIPCTQNIL